ncbi:MAG: serine hydrolase domain-containing protein, partial [Parvularcula sp.]|nr:serine hydrolase domain-containing protein [Parvularcula sp.]
MLNKTALIALALCGACASRDGAEHSSSLVLDQEADAYLSALTDLGEFNGAVVLLRDGKLLHRAAYELADEELPSLSVSIDSQFDLRSVSKLFAKASVYELEAAGAMDPDMPIAVVFPDFPRGDEITIRHLMDNTSGLPREYTTLERPLITLSASETVAQAGMEP